MTAYPTDYSTDHQVAAALKHIARNESIKAYVLRDPALYAVLRSAAMRFIGGETLSECVETVLALRRQGHAATIDFMGESTRDAEAAQQATQEFLQVIHTIATHNLDASVSLDISHIGLAISAGTAFANASTLAQAAHSAGIEIMISMEGSERIASVLNLYQRLSERFTNIGITLQAYLHRTAADLAEALERPGKIRLVKGAFEEPEHLAEPRGAAVDASYRDYLESLLVHSHSCSIATHDPALLDDAHRFIQEHHLDTSTLEFEMLKGVTPERLAAMAGRGYRTRVYVPYGQEWYLYLCHRLAEYPPNVFQAIVDAVG